MSNNEKELLQEDLTESQIRIMKSMRRALLSLHAAWKGVINLPTLKRQQEFAVRLYDIKQKTSALFSEIEDDTGIILREENWP